MTEIPEHLLARSRAARARLTGEAPPDDAPAAGGEAAGATAAAAPATTTTRVPVAIPEGAPPAPPEPPKAWVEAAESRQKIPLWVMPVLLFLPVWLIMYVGTLEEPTREEGVLYEGGVVYAEKCATCHGGEGGGGVGPAFSNGAVIEAFANPESQIAWVVHGTAGFQEQGIGVYGTAEKAVGGSGAAMPAFGDELTTEELLWVVFYERIELGGHEEDLELAEKLFDMADHGELELPEHFLEGEGGDFTGDGEIGAILALAAAELDGGDETAAE